MVRLTSPTCGNTINHECPAVTVYGPNFTAGDTEYNYTAGNDNLAPGEADTGAKVWEVPRRTDSGARPRLTFTFLDIGRWNITDAGT